MGRPREAMTTLIFDGVPKWTWKSSKFMSWQRVTQKNIHARGTDFLGSIERG